MQNKLDMDQSISTDGRFYRILVSVEVDSDSSSPAGPVLQYRAL